MRKIRIFDSTLRDGEQAPGFSMSIQEKVAMAKQLERLNVDVIEAGFAIVSPGDFTSVKTIASEIKNASVASLEMCIRDSAMPIRRKQRRFLDGTQSVGSKKCAAMHTERGKSWRRGVRREAL